MMLAATLSRSSAYILWLGLVTEFFGFCFMLPWGDFRQPGHAIYFLLAAALALIGYTLACLVLSKRRLPSWVAWIMTVLFRICLLSMYPGDDIWRYLWEGKIQNFGFNPYHLAPNSYMLESLRTSYWSLINHPEYSAIYAPLAQLTFRGLSAIEESVLAFKTFFMLADLGSIVVLRYLLKYSCMSSHRLWWYAWNPLVIYSFSGGGHFDSLMILYLLSALIFLLKNKEGWAIFFLSTAIYMKQVAIVALPFFAARMKRKSFLFWALLPLPAFYWFYGGFFPRPMADRQFWRVAFSHGSLASLFPPESNLLLFWIFIVGVVLLLWRYYKNPLTGIHYTFLWLILASPVVHPWYVTWILPLACLTRTKSAWLLSATIFFYFLSWNEPGRLDLSQGKGLETLAIYIPVFLFLIFELWGQPPQKTGETDPDH